MQGQVPLLPATQGCTAGHGIFQVLPAGKHFNGNAGKGSIEKYCIRSNIEICDLSEKTNIF